MLNKHLFVLLKEYEDMVNSNLITRCSDYA